MLTKKTRPLAAMLTASLTLTGCFTAPGSADVYSVGQAQREQTVRMGTVESVRAVRIQSDGGGSAIGTLGGGALGAVAGSAIGGGKGSILTAIAGGLVGAVAGNAVGENLSTRRTPRSNACAKLHMRFLSSVRAAAGIRAPGMPAPGTSARTDEKNPAT
jgi:outer membrane lipoprotein SlyB